MTTPFDQPETDDGDSPVVFRINGTTSDEIGTLYAALDFIRRNGVSEDVFTIAIGYENDEELRGSSPAVTPLQAPTDEGGSDFAWLIERTDGPIPTYWDGRATRNNHGPRVTYHHDANSAVRFARQEDAERIIAWLLEGEPVVAREHGWFRARTTPAVAPPQPPPDTELLANIAIYLQMWCGDSDVDKDKHARDIVTMVESVMALRAGSPVQAPLSKMEGNVRRALRALYIAVPEVIARDVNRIVWEFIDALRATAARNSPVEPSSDTHCTICSHSMADNPHGFDQNDGWLDYKGKLHLTGRCTYCKHCRAGVPKQ